MKKRIQNYLSGKKEGFSLVELIIVIAIMAILIGIVALAVIPYLEQSRKGKDQQTVDTVYSAFQTMIADQKITKNLTVTIPASGDASATVAAGETATADAILTFMAKALNATDKTDICKGTSAKLESGTAKGGNITCKFDASKGEITVFAGGDATIVSSNKGTPTLNAAAGGSGD